MKQELNQLLFLATNLLSSRRVQLFIIIFTTILLYLQATPNSFVLDDETFVNWNLIKNLKNIPLFFTGILPEDHLGDYRPLKGVILALNYRFWGTNPVGYIVQAMLIHLVTTYLVYHIVQMLVRKPYVAFLSSLVFALHPAQVEAIAFITASSDMVGISFYLAAVYAFLRWRAASKPALSLVSPKSKWLLVSLISFGFGLISYEMVFTLPLLLALYLWSVEKRKWHEIVKLLLPYVMMFAFYSYVRWGILKFANDKTYQWGSLIATFYISAVVILRYLMLVFLPLTLQINHQILPGIFAYRVIEIHPLTPVPQLTNPYVLVALAVIGLVLVLFLRVRHHYPLVTFAGGWFFLTLTPVLTLYPLPTYMSERYLYLALAGFSILVGLGATALITSKSFGKSLFIKTSGIVLMTGFLLFYWGRSYTRILDWRSSETLWSKELGYNPDSMLANHNLGMAYFAKGELGRAVKHLTMAADRNWQGVPKVYLNLGKAYLASKNYPAAREQFQYAVTLSPQYAEGQFYLANVERELGKVEAAKAGYLRTLEVDSKFYDARVQLARVYFQQQEYEMALAEMRRVINDEPRIMPAYYDLAAMLIKLDRLAEAGQMLEVGLKEDPHSEVLKNAYEAVKSEEKDTTQ